MGTSTESLYLYNLPFPRQFLTRLMDQLSTHSPPESKHDENIVAGTRTGYHQSLNSFSKLSSSQLSKVKPLMLTLHCLFPNELLLALDILDRRLVRRLTVENADDENIFNASNTTKGRGTVLHAQSQQNDTTWQRRTAEEEEQLFFVRSTSATSSGRSHAGIEKNYEVRLQAWNCTCPAFALSVLQGMELSDDVEPSLCQNDAEDGQGDCRFGGTLTRDCFTKYPPVCKHLLACILVAWCPALFGGGMEDQGRVNAEELAGWCAGWGG
ncbi:hypothetical protein VTN02DRAFT_2212 [Thermoascus thermophilus]